MTLTPINSITTFLLALAAISHKIESHTLTTERTFQQHSVRSSFIPFFFQHLVNDTVINTIFLQLKLTSGEFHHSYSVALTQYDLLSPTTVFFFFSTVNNGTVSFVGMWNTVANVSVYFSNCCQCCGVSNGALCV